ncbi:MAG: hypothetical protein PHY09_10045 [Desulfuromonadaceae bacterium]|nr:hypothetical protein [Desulfuromonadaceae bacterium]MDD5104722.1 hypothetical protein [Desulfuromonadaceae bacterium]
MQTLPDKLAMAAQFSRRTVGLSVTILIGTSHLSAFQFADMTSILSAVAAAFFACFRAYTFLCRKSQTGKQSGRLRHSSR